MSVSTETTKLVIEILAAFGTARADGKRLADLSGYDAECIEVSHAGQHRMAAGPPGLP